MPNFRRAEVQLTRHESHGAAGQARRHHGCQDEAGENYLRPPSVAGQGEDNSVESLWGDWRTERQVFQLLWEFQLGENRYSIFSFSISIVLIILYYLVLGVV